MNSLPTALIAFACTFGAVLVGTFLNTVLPEHHLRDASKDAVKVGTGLIATLVALVLGLLVGSAKNSFDAVSSGLTQGSAKIILLGELLSQYGPEAKEARDLLRHGAASTLQLIWPDEENAKAQLEAFEQMNGSENVQRKLRELTPANEVQRLILAQALQLSGDLAQAHWLLVAEMRSSLPTPLLVVLVFWVTTLFVSFGMFAPRNATVIVVLVVCALSVSTAIYLILEMSQPLEGLIKVSSAPLRKALEHLGR